PREANQMLFQRSLLPGRSSECTVSDFPVSSQIVLSSVKPWSITTAGRGSASPHGTVTSTDSGMPSKVGTVPRQRTYPTGSGSLLVWTSGTSATPARFAYGTDPGTHSGAAAAGTASAIVDATSAARTSMRMQRVYGVQRAIVISTRRPPVR